jgi:MFS family permease
MLNVNDKFVKLIIVYTLFIIGSLFFASLFELYFSTLGLNMAQIVFSSIGIYLIPIMIIPLISKIDTRKFIPIGFATFGLAAIVLYFFQSFYAPFLARAFIGLGIIFFWIPFNTLFYEFNNKNAAFLGSIYYAISPILSLFLPAFSGLVVVQSGYNFLFLSSFVFFLGSFLLVPRLIERKELRFDFTSGLKSITGLRTLFFIEGFAINSITSLTLSTMILIYAHEPIEFGAILSGVTIFSIVASFVTAKLSDRSGERRVFVIASAFGFLISAIFTALSNSTGAFFLGFGLIGFFRAIILPLPLALAADSSKNLPQMIMAREVFLNLGRIVVVVLGYLIITYSDIRALLIVQTIVAAFYIPIFELKKRKFIKSS